MLLTVSRAERCRKVNTDVVRCIVRDGTVYYRGTSRSLRHLSPALLETAQTTDRPPGPDLSEHPYRQR